VWQVQQTGHYLRFVLPVCLHQYLFKNAAGDAQKLFSLSRRVFPDPCAVDAPVAGSDQAFGGSHLEERKKGLRLFRYFL